MCISKTAVLANNDLCGKLVSSLELPITFYERFKVPLVPRFAPDFNLLNQNKITILSQFLVKILKWL